MEKRSQSLSGASGDSPALESARSLAQAGPGADAQQAPSSGRPPATVGLHETHGRVEQHVVDLPAVVSDPAWSPLRKLSVVFLDGVVIDVATGESTYSRCLARAIMHRYHQGAGTHRQLTVDELATRQLERDQREVSRGL